MKLLAYRIFDPPKAKANAAAKAEPASDLTPQIAKRAYEIYQERGRSNGQAVQDWERAEREIRQEQSASRKEEDENQL